MMAARLTHLPFDVLLEIFQLLSAKEITSIGQTCRYLQHSTSDRAVWVKQNSYLRTQFPSVDSSSVSTKDLRRNVVREAVVHEKWQKTLSTPRRFTEVYRTDYYNPVEFVEVLPGGAYLLVVHDDGAVNIRLVVSDPAAIDADRGPLEASHICPISNLEVVDCVIFHSSENDGYLLTHLLHEYPYFYETDHIHIRVYTFHADPTSFGIDIAASFIADSTRYYHFWGRSGTTFGALYQYENFSELYVSCFNVPLFSKPNIPFNEVRFELLDFKVTGDPCFVMVSPHRVVVAGSACCIWVYDLPSELMFLPSTHLGDRSAVRVAPIWKWQDTNATASPSFHCSPIFYSGCDPHTPMVWFVEEGKFIHLLKLSHSENPVKEHRRVSVQCDFNSRMKLSIGSARALWCSGERGTTTLSTLTLSDSMPLGSFSIPLKHGLTNFLDKPSFDEVSGRVAFIIRDRGRDFCVFIADIVDIP